MTEPTATIPLDLVGPLDADGIAAVVAALAPALGPFLAAQRWFGDKLRAIERITVADAAVATDGEDWYALPILDVAFTDGGVARYFVPLAIVAYPPSVDAPIAVFGADPNRRFVYDALRLPGCHAWLLRHAAADADWTTLRGGAFDWSTTPAFADYVAIAEIGATRVSGAEQSNTSIVYADALILKIFRKLQSETNPDIEIGRYLATGTGFRHTPRLAGDLTYRAVDGASASVAMLQSFVPSIGDGWAFVLAQLDALLGGEAGAARRSVAAVRVLGERTGELHVALAAETADPAFAPEPATAADVAAWSAATLGVLERMALELRRHRDSVGERERAAVDRLSERLPALQERARGYASLVGVAKTRVHGDYHLGQTLVTPTRGFVLLDFEGEPARPVAERREKTSPLKDVAGMLRSFAYARGTAALSADDPARAEPLLADWERKTRTAFLDGYRAATGPDAAFLPIDPAGFAAALSAWELDKAVYELGYELNHRPDWLGIPLAALLRG